MCAAARCLFAQVCVCATFLSFLSLCSVCAAWLLSTPPRSTAARTYLFCAIRPEVKYHAYTFSTCNFAKNASVVKLQPKKAVAFSSPAERKLMDELEQMKVSATAR